MLHRMAVLVPLLVVAAVSGGCGTFGNQQEPGIAPLPSRGLATAQ